MIGGLVSSTVLTLLVLPTLYNLIEGAGERRRERRAARDADPHERSGGEEHPVTRRELRAKH